MQFGKQSAPKAVASTNAAPLQGAPMLKKHEGLGNHKKRLTSHAAVKANAAGTGFPMAGQPGSNSGSGFKTGHTKTNN